MPSTTAESVRPAPPTEWLRRIWERMVAMYGHAWHSVHGVSPQDEGTGRLTVDGDTWAKALSGITGTQMAAGLAACLAEGGEFPPSAPRFRGMCLGVPSFPSVRRDTDKADPFTRLVWQNLDGYLYRQAPADKADKMLRDAYELAREHVMLGGQLPEQAAGEIEHEPNAAAEAVKIPDTRESRSAHLQDLLGQLYNPKTSDPDYDPTKAFETQIKLGEHDG